MNRMKETFDMIRKAEKSGVNERLSKKENWTPDLVYVHVTRLFIGLVFGFLLCLSLQPVFQILFK